VTFRSAFCCLALLPCAGALLLQAGEPPKAALDPNLAYQGKRSNPVTYKVDFSVVVTPPYHAKVLKVWLPVPQTDAAQEVGGSEFSTFPLEAKPRVGTEKLYGNRFAHFEFKHPEGAQVIRHRFTVKTWEVRWDIDPGKVASVKRWPGGFDRYLRSERLVVVDGRFRKLAAEIVPKRRGAAEDLGAVLAWVDDNLRYDHADASLQASALHALEKRHGHCSDYHGLCAALGRALNYPTRVAYGINPYPKNSPSHCKLEAFLPPYGWVPFDVSETQQLVKRIQADPTLDAGRKAKLADAARERLRKGFRDNTWFLQTRGTDYELEPPAARRAAVVRTAYVEADGVALPEPDPANPKQREFAWMTVHRYVADRAVVNPFKDWRTLEQGR
jgi:transglutaminase-like putative cysteine protease